jgi:hypothetical protein
VLTLHLALFYTYREVVPLVLLKCWTSKQKKRSRSLSPYLWKLLPENNPGTAEESEATPMDVESGGNMTIKRPHKLKRRRRASSYKI